MAARMLLAQEWLLVAQEMLVAREWLPATPGAWTLVAQEWLPVAQQAWSLVAHEGLLVAPEAQAWVAQVGLPGAPTRCLRQPVVRAGEIQASGRQPCGGQSGLGCQVPGALTSMPRWPSLTTALPWTRPLVGQMRSSGGKPCKRRLQHARGCACGSARRCRREGR